MGPGRAAGCLAPPAGHPVSLVSAYHLNYSFPYPMSNIISLCTNVPTYCDDRKRPMPPLRWGETSDALHLVLQAGAGRSRRLGRDGPAGCWLDCTLHFFFSTRSQCIHSAQEVKFFQNEWVNNISSPLSKIPLNYGGDGGCFLFFPPP